MANNKTGVIYCSTGRCPYFGKESSYSLYADRSAGTLKKFLPDIDITLFSDTLDHPPLKNISKIELLPDFPRKGAFFSKIRSLQNSPYEKTLYLDSDTMILDKRVGLIFVMLEKLDIKTYDIKFPAKVIFTPQTYLWLDEFVDCPYFVDKKKIIVTTEKMALQLMLFAGDITKYGLARAMSKRDEDTSE